MSFTTNEHGFSTLRWLPLVAAGLLLGGCGGSETGQERASEADAAGDEPVEPTLTIPEPMQVFQDDGNVAEIEIEGNDRMRFDLDEFTVEAGQMVRLTLVHVGSLPKNSMGHNVVVLVQGEDVIDFGSDANEQGGEEENHYVPEPVRDRVVAFTELIGGGETATVEFRAPEEPGEYPFLCSFPGHFSQMNGVMVVEGA